LNSPFEVITVELRSTILILAWQINWKTNSIPSSEMPLPANPSTSNASVPSYSLTKSSPSSVMLQLLRCSVFILCENLNPLMIVLNMSFPIGLLEILSSSSFPVEQRECSRSKLIFSIPFLLILR